MNINRRGGRKGEEVTSNGKGKAAEGKGRKGVP
jgi:hypothetical protein